MDKNLENILNELLEGQNKILNKIGVIDKKLNSVYSQTIRLTELQEEIKQEFRGLRECLS